MIPASSENLEDIVSGNTNLDLVIISDDTNDELSTLIFLHRELPVPVIICSGEKGAEERAKYLESGADVCLSGDLCPEELIAQAKALLRRNRIPDIPKHKPFIAYFDDIGEFVFDFERCIKIRENVYYLTTIENNLLALLILNINKILPHEYLLTKIWGLDTSASLGCLYVHINYLRRKVEVDYKHPRHIRSHSGVGYCFYS